MSDEDIDVINDASLASQSQPLTIDSKERKSVTSYHSSETISMMDAIDIDIDLKESDSETESGTPEIFRNISKKTLAKKSIPKKNTKRNRKRSYSQEQSSVNRKRKCKKSRRKSIHLSQSDSNADEIEKENESNAKKIRKPLKNMTIKLKDKKSKKNVGGIGKKRKLPSTSSKTSAKTPEKKRRKIDAVNKDSEEMDEENKEMDEDSEEMNEEKEEMDEDSEELDEEKEELSQKSLTLDFEKDMELDVDQNIAQPISTLVIVQNEEEDVNNESDGKADENINENDGKTDENINENISKKNKIKTKKTKVIKKRRSRRLLKSKMKKNRKANESDIEMKEKKKSTKKASKKIPPKKITSKKIQPKKITSKKIPPKKSASKKKKIQKSKKKNIKNRSKNEETEDDTNDDTNDELLIPESENKKPTRNKKNLLNKIIKKQELIQNRRYPQSIAISADPWTSHSLSPKKLKRKRNTNKDCLKDKFGGNPEQFKLDIMDIIDTINAVDKHIGYNVEHEPNGKFEILVSQSGARTLKLFFQIAKGKYIVSKEWIYDSMKRSQWQKPESYVMDDFADVIEKSREDRRQRLFSGYKIYVQERESLDLQPNTSVLRELCGLLGGEMCVTCKECDLCISHQGMYKELVSEMEVVGRDVSEVDVLRSKWIFDSTVVYEEQDRDLYRVRNPDEDSDGSDHF